ncbi:MAG: Asp-tRNA(Asn)/Glu-tRNA(Gln) amidotransferase subunit GatC [bacterium]
MAISRDDVRHIAELARLEMPDDELELFTGQLNDILKYAAKLNELDLEGVEPTSHAVPVKNVFRDDEPRPSIPVDDALSNAPDPQQHFFGVPRIIEE